jgi:uncharacterized protein (TIGR02246 family)
MSARPGPSAATAELVGRFNEAWNAQDLEALMALMADECVFENTSPAPDGERFEGREAVRAYFRRFFEESPRARFEWEEVVALGDRAAVRWRYSWLDAAGRAGHVRGLDLFLVRDGRIAEKLSYVKG